MGRSIADLRRAQRVAVLATVRMETAPGEQLQIDFGQKRIAAASVAMRVFLLVAVLSYLRRLFVKAFSMSVATTGGSTLRLRFGLWAVRRGCSSATMRGALVLGRGRATRTVSYHPSYLSFCRDWKIDISPAWLALH